MNVLVLGANGYTGAKLVETLLNADIQFVVWCVKCRTRASALEKLGMDLRVGDIRDEESLQQYGGRDSKSFSIWLPSCRIEPSESKTILLNAAAKCFSQCRPHDTEKIYLDIQRLGVWFAQKDRPTERDLSAQADLRLGQNDDRCGKIGKGKCACDCGPGGECLWSGARFYCGAERKPIAAC